MHSLEQIIGFLEHRQQTEDWDIRDEAIIHLKEYKALLDGMAETGLKKIVFDNGQEITIDKPLRAPVYTERPTAEVHQDKENLLVCECGQKVERWYQYCYHCGKKLLWKKQ